MAKLADAFTDAGHEGAREPLWRWEVAVGTTIATSDIAGLVRGLMATF